MLGSSVHGILQARTLEWVGRLSSRGSSPSRDQTHVSYVSCIGRWVLCHECHTWEAKTPLKSESEVAQLCPTLCDPMDCTLPGSSLHGILQARVPEWVAISTPKFETST